MEFEPTVYTFASNDGDTFTIEEEYLKYSPALLTLVKNTAFKQDIKDGGIAIDEPACFLRKIFTYLKTGSITEEGSEDFVDFVCKLHLFGIPVPNFDHFTDCIEFTKIQLTELWQRTFTKDNPKVEKFKLSEVINTIPSLIAPFSSNIAIYSPIRAYQVNPLLISAAEKLKKLKISAGGIDLSKYDGKIVLAGGSLVSLLLQRPVKDYDFFFVGCTKKEAMSLVQKICLDLFGGAPNGKSATIIATKKCWTIKYKKGSDTKQYQFIFRIYKNIDEILLGFDIDSCCMVYDGDDMYLSKRCLHSLQNHVNVIDFTRMSPTYEYRLYKYSLRGFDVSVPGFDPQNVIYQTRTFSASDFKMHINQKTGMMTILPRQKGQSKKNVGAMRRYGRHRPHPYSLTTNLNIAPYDLGALPYDILGVPNPSARNANNNNDFELEEVDGKEEESESESEYEDHYRNQTKPGDVTRTWINIQQPLLKLSGLDVLLFFSFGVLGRGQVKISDYDEFLNRNLGVQVSQFDIHHATKCYSLHGKWVKCPLWLRNPKAAYDEFMQLIHDREIVPEWTDENAGDQITSSFHAITVKDTSKWYNGLYYSTTLKAETVSSLDARQYAYIDI